MCSGHTAVPATPLGRLRSWLCCHPGKKTQSCSAMCQKRASHRHPSPPREHGVSARGCWGYMGLEAARVLAWAEVRASSGASCEWGCCFASSGVEDCCHWRCCDRRCSHRRFSHCCHRRCSNSCHRRCCPGRCPHCCHWRCRHVKRASRRGAARHQHAGGGGTAVCKAGHARQQAHP